MPGISPMKTLIPNMALAGWFRMATLLLASRVTKWAASRMKGGRAIARDWAGFGDQGVDAKEGSLPAYTRAQLVLIRHLGEQDIGQGLRTGKPKTDQQQADRDERGGHEGDGNQADPGDHQQQLLGLHQPDLFTDEIGDRHTADQWNEDECQQDDRVHFEHVIGQVEHRPGHQRGNQDGHEILGDQDEEDFYW